MIKRAAVAADLNCKNSVYLCAAHKIIIQILAAWQQC